MPLAPGATVGPYEVMTLLGAGGMGEVYRARDSRLKRDVALKVLREDVVNDPDRLARFQREAEALAALNHPGIGAIYGLEGEALVLELVDGPTLADRIAQGPVPIDEALPIIRQLIDALEYAHEKGIVHRDLKPSNIKVTADGNVKVLDFGLAKALGEERVAANPNSSPTLTMRATILGTILGTAGYMAPEQARAQNVDKRADIWAFGVVVYEMLSGRQLFSAPTVSDTLALVLTKEPDLESVAPRLRPLLRRCLERDPRKRLRDIGDARALLEEAEVVTVAAPRRSRLAWALGAFALACTLAAGVLATLHFREQPPAVQPMRFEISPPEKTVFGGGLSVSPDGRKIAFIAQRQGSPRMIWVRPIDSVQARPLTGTEFGTGPMAWSPDSRFLAVPVLGKILKVEVSGVSSTPICDCATGITWITWGRDGMLLVSTSTAGGIMRVSDAGGSPSPVLPATLGVFASVHLLGDGRHFLYARRNVQGPAGDFPGASSIYLGFLDKPAADARPSQPLLTADSTRFTYAAAEDRDHGYILFQRDGGLLAQRFDIVTQTVTGQAALMANDVAFWGASATGVLVYRTGTLTAPDSELQWYNRQGKPLGRVGPQANNGSLQLSPDGKTVVVDRRDRGGASHLWTGDLARGVFSRINPGETPEVGPAVSSDGRVAFSFAPSGVLGDIYAGPANGTGTPVPWVKSANVKHANHFSADGRFLIYDDHNGPQAQDLWILPLTPPSGPGKPVPFLTTPADETFGQFSPDSKWIAYSSNESGRREVYVRSFAPDRVPAHGDGKWLVSTAGGDKPRWRHDGKEIFYLSLDGKMVAVPLKTAPVFEPEVAIPLFNVQTIGFFPYDVAADGRFLINTPPAATAETSTPITVVVNWTELLKK